MNVLVLNCGSSSVRFQIIETDLEKIEAMADRQLVSGQIERIGSESIMTVRIEGKRPIRKTAPVRDHKIGIDSVLKWIVSEEAGIPGIDSLAEIQAVGHRVVHGGERFTESAFIDDDVLHEIEDCIELAPLHNPANLKGIYAVRQIFGAGLSQVAVFDTSFHSTIPESAFLYAIPYQLYRRHKIRRYGFHGTSHRYVAYRYRNLVGKKKEDVNIITLHLGNGCSICSIRGGRSIDTSMGLTPLEGLVMGTRSGDVDPAVVQFLALKEGFTLAEVETVLNKQSGLLGISGLTHDMKELLEEAHENDDRRARLAIEVFCLRVKKYIGAFYASMGGADAIIFTGGIGENSAEIRKRIFSGMEFMGIRLDETSNETTVQRKEGKISADGTSPEIWVLPTNEELLIARDTVRCIAARPNNQAVSS